MRSDFSKTVLLTALGLGMVNLLAQETPKPKPPPTTPKPGTPATPPAAKPAPKPSGVAPQNRFVVEQVRRLRADLEDLKNAYNLQLQRTTALELEMKSLRTANTALKRQLELQFASNKDVDELAKRITELDSNRLNDRKVQSAQIEKILNLLGKIKSAAPQGTRNGSGNDPAPVGRFKYREHKVQAGEFLSTILAAYNSAFKEEGLRGRVSQTQVLKANPGVTANKLFVGQTIRIPLPGEIK